MNVLKVIKDNMNEFTYEDYQIPIQVIEELIKVASTAPSGANKQPWTYAVVSDCTVKQKIGLILDEELEDSQYLIALFKQNYGISSDMEIIKHYYVQESASISAGFLLTALEFIGIKYEVLQINQQITKELKRSKNESLLFLVTIQSKIKNANHVLEQVKQFYQVSNQRRSIRSYINKQVNRLDLVLAIEITNNIMTKLFKDSPYYFHLVENDLVKQTIRENAEIIEKRLYEELLSKDWKEALSPLGTNWEKKHLTEAPCLVIPFSNKGDINKGITGIATGVFIQLIHQLGLATLTYTPSPMHFLGDIVNIKEKVPFMVLPVGYPNPDDKLPNITRKLLKDVLVIY